MRRVANSPLAWTTALVLALLWPSHAISTFDGIPLSGRAEAILLGVVVPALWWLNRSFLAGRWGRIAIGTLLGAKVIGLMFTQHGLCARASTAAPFMGVIQTIPIEEPAGFLRSWDGRADWRAAEPGCTAIIDRPLGSTADFPVWFVNLVDFIRPGARDITLELKGHVRAKEAGTLSIETGGGMDVSGQIGANVVASSAGRTIVANLTTGVHAIALTARLTGEHWKLVPLWNGADAWRRLAFTTEPPTVLDAATPLLGGLITALVVCILFAWGVSTWAVLRPSPAVLVWTAAAALAMVLVGSQPRIERLAVGLLLLAAIVPIGLRLRNLYGAFLLIGVPWLTFFGARTFAQIGRITAYSADDWLTYQVAGYRIFMNGYWLQGGTDTFDYQPLYRWLSGFLHVIFGDSSVGETYWDAACLLAGALLAFQLTRTIAGFRAGIFAAAATLATFSLGTIWYFIGRGLSEITASGFAFMAAFFLLRARLGRWTSAAASGVLATLMFYSRLNHLVFALSLVALLTSRRNRGIAAPGSKSDPFVNRVRLTDTRRVGAALLYGGIFAAGLLAFAARTWWYTGSFSLFYGTSLKHNDTGLHLTTLGSLDVWQNVIHSVSSIIWMNEPPRPDLRAFAVLAGVIAMALALFRVPRFRRLPTALAIVSLGAVASSLFVHTHNYPGRMSIHLVPFATAAAVSAGRLVVASRSWHQSLTSSEAALQTGKQGRAISRAHLR